MGMDPSTNSNMNMAMFPDLNANLTPSAPCTPSNNASQSQMNILTPTTTTNSNSHNAQTGHECGPKHDWKAPASPLLSRKATLRGAAKLGLESNVDSPLRTQNTKLKSS